MDILMIGGTVFLGRAVVDEALARGHQVTTFTRGRSNPALYEGRVKTLTGDRRTDISALSSGTWDAVVDTCGYFPADVRASAEALADRAGRYAFISSISAYGENLKPGGDESTPVAELGDAPGDEITGESYGPLKVLCEQASSEVFGDRALNIRPGLIVGPHDPSDRFTYWPVRLAEPETALAPRTGAPMQVIDVRDLGAWIVTALERGLSGTYNTTGPETPWDEMIAACAPVAPVEWVDEDFLIEQGVQPWGELPCFLPGNDSAFNQVSSARAVADGLTFRSLRTTAVDTLAWARTWPSDRAPRAGMSREREAQILSAWRSRSDP